VVDINFEITEEDIKKYLKKNKQFYKYYEPLFIKYLKENKDELSKEIAKILISELTKLNNSDELCSFDSKNIHNLDLSGICHILISATRYYDWDRPVMHIGCLNGPLGIIAHELEIPFKDSFEVINEAVDNYRICGKIEIEDNVFMRFKMSREHARNELIAYQDYYGIDKVKLIRKIVKEGVR